MPSLIASFFKKNVVLNMKATDESRPQTASDVGKKEQATPGVWNLPRGYTPPFVPMSEVAPKQDKKEAKNSLIAEFFRRTVTLNNNAADESVPQTVYKTIPQSYFDAYAYADELSRGVFEEYSRTFSRGSFGIYTKKRERKDVSSSVYFDNKIGTVIVKVFYGEEECQIAVPNRFFNGNTDTAIDRVVYQVTDYLNVSDKNVVKKIKESIGRSMREYLRL